MMKYYDKNNQVRTFDESTPYKIGETAQIFKLREQTDNIILKKYYPYTSKFSRINPLVFNTLKNIDHTNFIKLLNYFKKTLILGHLKSTDQIDIKIQGYIREELKERKINILTEKKIIYRKYSLFKRIV